VKVEVLYVAECPFLHEAVKLLRDVLGAQGVASEIHEVLVANESMAHELGFLGSPSIRIDGRDVGREPQDPQSFALSCRLYAGSDRLGLPPVEMIHHAVIEALGGRT
jgi:hypothetical protein